MPESIKRLTTSIIFLDNMATYIAAELNIMHKIHKETKIVLVRVFKI